MSLILCAKVKPVYVKQLHVSLISDNKNQATGLYRRREGYPLKFSQQILQRLSSS